MAVPDITDANARNKVEIGFPIRSIEVHALGTFDFEAGRLVYHLGNIGKEEFTDARHVAKIGKGAPFLSQKKREGFLADRRAILPCLRWF